MRLLFAVLVLIQLQIVNGTSGFALADNPFDSGAAGSLRVTNAIRSGSFTAAISELKSMPSDQRLEWLSQYHQSGADQNSNGGAAMANYAELIGLIESAISPDNWLAAGGTSSMREFRQGVRIDPSGLIERFDSSKAVVSPLKILRDHGTSSQSANISLSDLGEWQQPSALRWISIHQLDDQIAERIRDSKGLRANVAMEVLGGLYRIDFVAFDKESREWFLGGPAGNLVTNASRELLNPESGLPPVLLEDLLSIAPHVLRNKGEFGCSIDPDPKRLIEAYEMAGTASSMRSMQRQPERWAEQWRQKLGRQQAKVVGLNQDSPTGYALLIADAHMKRLGLGLEACPTQMKTYWQEKEAFPTSINGTDSSMVRWWFSSTDHKIPMDPDRKIYHFASSNVQVLSEAQMMNEKGERVTTKSPDIAADAFARKFTRSFDQLQRDYPIYGRLRHVFDLAVALEIVRHEISNGNGKPFKAIDNLDVQPRLPVTPLEVNSVAATHRMPNGTMSAIVSGGVSIHNSGLGRRLTVDKSETNKVSLESSNDASKLIGTEVSRSSTMKRSLNKSLQPQREKPFWR